MSFVPKMNSVENEESMWKHSPKSWGMPKCVLLQCVSDSNSVSSELTHIAAAFGEKLKDS